MEKWLNKIHLGGCLELMKQFPDNSIDSIVTDPPYFLTNNSGNGFMGKLWDSLSPSNAVVEAYFRSCLLVLPTEEENTVVQNANMQQCKRNAPKSNVPYVEKKPQEVNPKTNQKTRSVAENVITKEEALDLCNVMLPGLTNVVNALPKNVLFVESPLFQNVHSNAKLAHLIVFTLREDPEWLEKATTFSNMVMEKQNVTEGQIGNGLENKFITEIITNASNVENTVNEKKSNVTISHHTNSQKTIQKLTSLPCVRHAIKLCMNTPSFIPILSQSFHYKWAKEAIRILKPGGHLLAMGGTRTYHRLASAIEDAGFEIRDMIAWVYGSGFPKSLDVSKSIDSQAGVKREVVGQVIRGDVEKAKTSGVTLATAKANRNNKDIFGYGIEDITTPATDEAKQWDGWGTALKPALEPITLARKPLESTVAQNVIEYGTGALNIDGCRIGMKERTYDLNGGENLNTISRENGNDSKDAKGCGAYGIGAKQITIGKQTVAGRYPANFIHNGSKEVLELFPQSQSCNSPSNAKPQSKYRPDQGNYQPQGQIYPGDNGSAARFFYCTKTSQEERNMGCDDLDEVMIGMSNGAQIYGEGYDKAQSIGLNRVIQKRNIHPTVKPIKLMRYLCKLITPPKGIVLDPFAGSGSTLIAARLEGFNWIGIEIDEEYYKIAEKRVSKKALIKGPKPVEVNGKILRQHSFLE